MSGRLQAQGSGHFRGAIYGAQVKYPTPPSHPTPPHGHVSKGLGIRCRDRRGVLAGHRLQDQACPPKHWHSSNLLHDHGSVRLPEEQY